jgi:sorting nexin-8
VAVWIPPALQRNYLPTHFAFAPFSSASGSSTQSTESTAPSLLSILIARLPLDHDYDPGQADLSRLTNVMKALVEVNDHCWRGDRCELCEGVREGIGRVATHTQRHADLLEQRVGVSFASDGSKL